jgi:hypothetical protein
MLVRLNSTVPPSSSVSATLPAAALLVAFEVVPENAARDEVTARNVTNRNEVTTAPTRARRASLLKPFADRFADFMAATIGAGGLPLNVVGAV